MSRSFITGGLAGLLSSVAALALLSLALPLGDRAGITVAAVGAPEAEPEIEAEVATEPAGTSEEAQAPLATMVEIPEGSAFASPEDAAPADSPEAVLSAEAPQSAAPDPEAAPALTETQSAAEPSAEAAEAPAAMAPETETETVAEPASETAVAATGATPGLEVAASGEGSARVSGAGQSGGPPVPGQSVPVPEVAEPPPETAAEDAAEDTAGIVAEAAAEAPAAPAAEPLAVAEASPDDLVAPDTGEPESDAAPVSDVPEAAPGSATEPAAEPPAEPAAEPGAETTVEPAPPEPPQETAEPDGAAPQVPAPDSGTDGVGTASLPGDGAATGVRILRLPGMAEPATEAETAIPEAAPDVAAGGGTPLAGFAAAWTNPDGLVPIAVVILDIGPERGGAGAEMIAALPFAVTVAIDPMRADAADAARVYLAAGKEVALLIETMPAGATPADLEVAYQSYVRALPEAVALIGNPQASFLRSSLEAQHVASLLNADGRGLVTYQAGLNLARRAAEKAGTPVATIEKLFDKADSATMRRDLDRMAFSAAQKGMAVVALPATPDLLQELAAWAEGPSGAQVSIAPVSALMLPDPSADAASEAPEDAPQEPPAAAAGTEESESALPGKKVGTFSDTN